MSRDPDHLDSLHRPVCFQLWDSEGLKVITLPKEATQRRQALCGAAKNLACLVLSDTNIGLITYKKTLETTQMRYERERFCRHKSSASQDLEGGMANHSLPQPGSRLIVS